MFLFRFGLVPLQFSGAKLISGNHSLEAGLPSQIHRKKLAAMFR